MNGVHYIDGYKIYIEDGMLYVNSVKDKRFKTPAGVVFATGSVFRSYRKHFYHEYGRAYVGDKIVSEEVSKEVICKIKDML